MNEWVHMTHSHCRKKHDLQLLTNNKLENQDITKKKTNKKTNKQKKHNNLRFTII